MRGSHRPVASRRTAYIWVPEAAIGLEPVGASDRHGDNKAGGLAEAPQHLEGWTCAIGLVGRNRRWAHIDKSGEQCLGETGALAEFADHVHV